MTTTGLAAFVAVIAFVYAIAAIVVFVYESVERRHDVKQYDDLRQPGETGLGAIARVTVVALFWPVVYLYRYGPSWAKRWGKWLVSSKYD